MTNKPTKKLKSPVDRGLPMHGISRDAPARTIREWRQEAFVTLRELAEEVGIDASTISLWETGKRQPRATSLRRLAHALGIHPAQIKIVHEEVTPPKAEEVAAA